MRCQRDFLVHFHSLIGLWSCVSCNFLSVLYHIHLSCGHYTCNGGDTSGKYYYSCSWFEHIQLLLGLHSPLFLTSALSIYVNLILLISLFFSFSRIFIGGLVELEVFIFHFFHYCGQCHDMLLFSKQKNSLWWGK